VQTVKLRSRIEFLQQNRSQGSRKTFLLFTLRLSTDAIVNAKRLHVNLKRLKGLKRPSKSVFPNRLDEIFSVALNLELGENSRVVVEFDSHIN